MGGGHHTFIPDLIPRAIKNREEYAELHGYHFKFVNLTRYDLTKAHPVWGKLPAIVDSFNEYPEAEWVWWLDLDAIIMSAQIDLNSHLLSHAAMYKRLEKGVEIKIGGNKPSGHFTAKDPDVSKIDFIIAQDWNGVNAGSFMIRRSKFSKYFMDFWADPFFIQKDWWGREQDTLLHLITNHAVIRDHVGYVHMKAINAYSWHDDIKWAPGDLAVHFAGLWSAESCKDLFEEYWKMRKTVAQVKEEAKKKEEGDKR